MLFFLPARVGKELIFQAATPAPPAAAAGPGEAAVCLLFMIACLMGHEITAGGCELRAALVSSG